jgi:plastocyanin
MMISPRSRNSLFLGLAMSMLLVACGGGTTEPITVPADTDLEVHAVSGLRWDQPSYTAPAGEINVALVNEDTIRHTLVVIEGETIISGFELEINRKGDVDSGTITLEPGTYSVFCTVPGHQNMKAELIVE